MANLPASGDLKVEAVTSANDVKARIKAITEDDAAQGFTGLAKYLAFDTDLSADEAVATLKAAASDAPTPAVDEPADRKSYQADRSAASALAQPGGGAPAPTKSTALSGAVKRTNNRR